MRKIGILYGEENIFPQRFIEKVNEIAQGLFTAEAVSIDKVFQQETLNYTVIIDRISHDIPFYRSYLKRAAVSGMTVLNNPFRISQDDRFFKASIAQKLGIPVLKSALLPSHHRPNNTIAESFRNLVLPYNWDSIFSEIPFPNLMKSYSDSGVASGISVNRFHLFSSEDLFHMHRLTGQEVMMLEEKRDFESFYRVYYIGEEYTSVVSYQMGGGHSLGFTTDSIDSALENQMKEYANQLNQTLGYDISTADFGYHQGTLYAIDICHPAPDAELAGLPEEKIDEIIHATAQLAIRKADKENEHLSNLTWGSIIEKAAQSQTLHTVPATTAEVPLTADPIKKDNLKKIEGIGPKIEALLNESGIYTFSQLSVTTNESLSGILYNAGSRYRMHDPKSWPKQAKLASEDQWEALEVLQLELKGGREE